MEEEITLTLTLTLTLSLTLALTLTLTLTLTSLCCARRGEAGVHLGGRHLAWLLRG